MSDRERRVTFKLGREQHRQLQALATLKGLPLDEIAASAVIFHVSTCMRYIQGRAFPEVGNALTLEDIHGNSTEEVLSPPGYLTDRVPGDEEAEGEDKSELPHMELFKDNREIIQTDDAREHLIDGGLA